MRTRVVRIQLRLFVVITVAALAIMGLYYVKIPDQLGIGRFDVTVQLAEAGGLYPKALVTYRGIEVGQVRRLELRSDGGVLAHLEIDNGTHIPSSSVVNVRSASVVGEQYIDFVPDGSEDDEPLANGDDVPLSQTTLPTTTDDLLNSFDSLLASVPRKDLRTVVRELGLASDGVGRDLGRMIENGQSFAVEATSNLDETTTLIDHSDHVLATQQGLDPNIRRYAKSLRGFTRRMAVSDASLESLLRSGPRLLREVDRFTTGLGTELPGMLWEVAAAGEVARIYRDNIEHVLIVLPAAVASSIEVTPRERLDDEYVESNLWFKMSFPTPCTSGFPEKDKARDPSDVSLGPLPVNSYCRAPRDSALVVRGARNAPCPDSSRRGPSAAACGLVFDRREVQQTETMRLGRGELVDPEMVRLVAPNGPFFLLDDGVVAGPVTWQEFLMELVDG